MRDFRRVAGPLSFFMWLTGLMAYESPGVFFGVMTFGAVVVAGVAAGSFILDKLSGS